MYARATSPCRLGPALRGESDRWFGTNRKFLIIEVSNKYSRESRNLDAEVDAEAEAHFTAVGDAMADPESVLHFFWYHEDS